MKHLHLLIQPDRREGWLSTTAVVGLLLVAHSTVSPARAELLSVTATDNGTPLTFVPTVNTPGNLVGTFIDPNFSQISVDISGAPDVPSPDLGTVTLQVSGSTGGTHTINLTATQTGISNPATGETGSVTQTFNNLINGGGPATESFLINGVVFNGNSTTFPALPPGVSTAAFTDPNLPSILSDAQQFVATFTAAGQDLEMTQEFKAAAVPEPTSLLIFGTSLAAFGLFGWLRRKQPKGAAHYA